MPTHPKPPNSLTLENFQVIRMPSRASSLTGNFDWFSKRTYRLISIPSIQYNSFLHAGLGAQFTPDHCQLTQCHFATTRQYSVGATLLVARQLCRQPKGCKKLFRRESELGEVKLRLASSDRVFYSFTLILVFATGHDQVLATF